MWDFASLNTCEDEELFRRAPTRYTFGPHATPVLVQQTRLPDETRPEDTGSEVWPAAVALARHLEAEALRAASGRVLALFGDGSAKVRWRDVQRSFSAVQGLSVVELGAGMGLAGLAARALGARRVLLTDIEEALAGLKQNVDLNPKLRDDSNGLDVAPLDWRTAAMCVSNIISGFAQAKNRWKDAKTWRANYVTSAIFDVILCSDCVLWPQLSGPLRATLNNLLHESNYALLSVVHRCKEADEFPATLRCHFHVEELWTSPAEGGMPEGHIRIYRAARRARPLNPWPAEHKGERDAAALVSSLEVARSAGDIEKGWSCRSLESILGVRARTIADFKASVGCCWPGPHALSCRLTLVPSNEAKKNWRGKTPLQGYLAEVESLPASVFVKRVAPGELPERQPEDWAQCALGYLVELNFLRSFSEVLRRRGAPVPRCFTCGDDGSAELEEALRNHKTDETSNGEDTVAGELMLCRFSFLLEDFSPPCWEQHLFFSEPRCRAALRSLAMLHAASLGDADLLQLARARLRVHGGYWAMALPDFTDSSKLEQTWAALAFQFSALDEELFSRPSVVALGQRLRQVQAEVDNALRGDAKPRGLCLLHGDLRAVHWHFATGCTSAVEAHKKQVAKCLSKSTLEEDVEDAALVGFRWSGVGLGAQDVAHLMLTCAEFPLLEDGSGLRWLLLSCYLVPLHEKAGPELAPSPAEFLRDFRWACLDYAKVAIGHHLVGYDPAYVRAGKGNIRRPTHNRSLSQTLGLIRFLDRLLDSEEIPGYGAPSSLPRLVPMVVITGAEGQDADCVNGAFELEGGLSDLEREPPCFVKAGAPDGACLYVAANGTWCVSSAANAAARAPVCWAHSAAASVDSGSKLDLPFTARGWRVTVGDEWQEQGLRLEPRLAPRS